MSLCLSRCCLADVLGALLLTLVLKVIPIRFFSNGTRSMNKYTTFILAAATLVFTIGMFFVPMLLPVSLWPLCCRVTVLLDVLLLTLALKGSSTRSFDNNTDSMAVSPKGASKSALSEGLEKYWWTIPVGIFVIFVAFPVAGTMIYRKINKSPPSRGNPVHGDNQFVAWGPICDPIGSCLVDLWHLLTCNRTRRANPGNRNQPHGPVEALDGVVPDGIELQDVNGRPKRNDEEQQVAVNDNPERQSLGSNQGHVHVPVPKGKGKSVWSKMTTFGRDNRITQSSPSNDQVIAGAGAENVEGGPSTRPQTSFERTTASPSNRD